jgi:hypothetical protein
MRTREELWARYHALVVEEFNGVDTSYPGDHIVALHRLVRECVEEERGAIADDADMKADSAETHAEAGALQRFADRIRARKDAP